MTVAHILSDHGVREVPIDESWWGSGMFSIDLGAGSPVQNIIPISDDEEIVLKVVFINQEFIIVEFPVGS